MKLQDHIQKWKEFNSLEHNVINSFLDVYFKSEKNEEKDFIAIGFRIIVDIINQIHTSNNNQSFSPIISYNREFGKQSKKNRNILFVKALININRFRLSKLFKKPRFVCQESFNLNQLKNYSNGGLLIPISAYGKIINHRKRNIEVPESFVKNLSLKITDSIIQFNQGSIYTIDKVTIQEIIQFHFNEFSRDYFLLKKFAKIPGFIFSTGNKTAVRLLARIGLDNGQLIESFAHGHTLQNKDLHKFWMDLLISNRYYEQSKSLCNELKSYIQSQSFYSKTHEITFDYLSGQNRELKVDHKANPEKVNNVLVMGNATKKHTFSSVTAFEMETQRSIEESIFHYFNKQGKKVFYKPHPGGHAKSQLLDAYKELNFVEIENGCFENILNKYDLIAFYYTRTSTISAALVSNKPIILFDLGIESHCDKSREMLEKRCHIKSNQLMTEECA